MCRRGGEARELEEVKAVGGGGIYTYIRGRGDTYISGRPIYVRLAWRLHGVLERDRLLVTAAARAQQVVPVHLACQG